MKKTLPYNPLALCKTPLGKSGFLSAEDRQALLTITSTPRPLRANVDLVSEAIRTDSVYILTEGWACRYKIARGGSRQITGILVAGDICNLDSLMLEKVNFGVRTLTAASIVGMPRDRLQRLAAERPGIAQAFTWCAIQENATLNEWALSLGRHSARDKLARFLCEMTVRLGGRDGSGAVFNLQMTQEQIGDVLGLTSVHINRTLQQLRQEGLIVVDGRQITVPDMTELCRVGGFDGSYLHAGRSTDGEKVPTNSMD